jgi:hypothetical protein
MGALSERIDFISAEIGAGYGDIGYSTVENLTIRNGNLDVRRITGIRAQS